MAAPLAHFVNQLGRLVAEFGLLLHRQWNWKFGSWTSRTSILPLTIKLGLVVAEKAKTKPVQENHER